MLNTSETTEGASICDGLTIGWLSSGDFRSTVEAVSLTGMRLFRGTVSQRALIIGTTAPGFATVICPQSAQCRIEYLGETLDFDCLGFAGPGMELHVLCADACEFFLCQVPVTALESLPGNTTLRDNSQSRQLLAVAAGPGAALIRALNDLVTEYRRQSEQAVGDTWCWQAETDAWRCLAGVMTDARTSPVARSRGAHQQILRRALQVIHRQAGPLSLQDLAQQSGASPRTLQRVFRSALQISPQKYLRLHRLCGLRQGLLVTEKRVSSVTEIAADWGFMHMGRLAGEYRDTFGESPSVTLDRDPDGSNVDAAVFAVEGLG